MKKDRMGKNLGMLLLLSVLMMTSCFAQSALKITREDLIYFVLTDRFYDGDPSNNQNVRQRDPGAYHGGDFQGIIDKLDYIKDLGFTAIWISPVVANQIRGYHGYWPVDFYRTNENFGSLEKLKELVATAHGKGLKVLVDLVVNHTGIMHPWVGEPDRESWFHQRGRINNWNDQQAIEEGDLAGLPDLNQDNPEVRQYLMEMAKWWIRETGIDGYRLDTVRHVPKAFWREFVIEIKKEFPDFYLLGEVHDGRADYLAGYQQAGIDGLIDYPMYYPIMDVFGGHHSASRLVRAIEECAAIYPECTLMGTFIDNLDTPRFVSQIMDFRDERLKQALAFMMTYTGIPVMYYGTEIGLDGGADPDNRRDMDWSVKSPLTDYVRKLTAIRKANPALTSGSFEIIKVEEDVLGYLRRFEENIILTVFNLSDAKKRLTLSLPDAFRSEKGGLTELTGSKSLKLKDGKAGLNMGPRQVMIFRYDTRQ